MHARTNTNLPTLTQNGVSAWYAFGLWVNLVVIAVGVISTAIALILERAAKTAPGVGLLIGGLALAAFALRQADVALRRVDGVVPTVEPTTSIRAVSASQRTSATVML